MCSTQGADGASASACRRVRRARQPRGCAAWQALASGRGARASSRAWAVRASGASLRERGAGAARGRRRAGAHRGVHGPTATVVDRRLAPARALAQADAERDDGGGGALVSRSRSRAARWQGALRSSSSATGSPAPGLVVPEQLVFLDEGFSGAMLLRPALERLRDRAAEGCFEVLLCHCPDRLARRYAYQVLLLEELDRAGVEVVFLREGERSGSPEDELLRQFQGMIAEYERAQIRERTRRGKLYRARQGSQAVLVCAPFGYRYLRKTDDADGYFQVDPAEAEVVREVFRRYSEGDESIAEIARALSARGVPTRTGKAVWDRSTVWGMLRNPAYRGQAA